jgi:hypothetical protein
MKLGTSGHTQVNDVLARLKLSGGTSKILAASEINERGD